MDEPIELTPDEADALAELIWNLSVIEDHGHFNRLQLVEITVQTWRDLIAKPASRLRRVARRKQIVAP